MFWTTATDDRQALAVTATRDGTEVLVRRPDDPGKWLVFPAAEWLAFAEALRAGAFDAIACPSMTHTQGDLIDPAGKLYILARADLPPGLQAAQAAHAAFQLSTEHPEIAGAWHGASNCLVLLAVPDEPALEDWARRVRAAGLPCSMMVEPDIGNEATALAVAPSALTLFAGLPLLGKELAMA